MIAAPRFKQGVALIAVLWLVAALALIAVGIVQSVRSEIKTVSQDRQRAIMGAKADAAILLVLQQMQSTTASPPAAQQFFNVEFEGQAFQITARALGGLIDLNKASINLLAALYTHAGQLPAAQALSLAQATVEYRDMRGPNGSKKGFAATEDLLNVANFTYALYARLALIVSADLQEGSGKINPHAAPLGVLAVLSAGDVNRAQVLLDQQTSRVNAMDTTALNPEFVDFSVSRSFVVQAQTALSDGAIFITENVISLSPDPASGLTWRLLSSRKTIRSGPQSNA